MRSAQFLALAGLAAAQSVTIVIDEGIPATIVLPEWDTNSVLSSASSALSAETTVNVDVTSVVETDTITATPTSLVTVPTFVTSDDSAPTQVTVSGATSLSVKSLAAVAAAAVAGLALF